MFSTIFMIHTEFTYLSIELSSLAFVFLSIS